MPGARLPEANRVNVVGMVKLATTEVSNSVLRFSEIYATGGHDFRILMGIVRVRPVTYLKAFMVRNNRLALIKYFADQPTRDLAPFDLDWVKHLHREMYGNVWSWAGTFRLRNLSIGCHWPHIQDSLYNLLENLKVWEESNVDLIEQAARPHS
jgi:hypothetical protein